MELNFTFIVAIVAIVAGVVVIGGGIWLGLALLSPKLGKRVFGADAPPHFEEPQRRQAAYVREGSLAMYLLISGPMMLFFGVTQLQQAPFEVLRTVFWPLLLLGLTCAILRVSMARLMRKR